MDDTAPVPLPQRSSPPSQHQIALVIRDGRKVASQIASLGDSSKTTGSSRETLSRTSQDQTSMSTALEQDFTVEGKKGNLQCPFSKPASAGGTHDGAARDSVDHPPHSTDDPICAAIAEEGSSQQAGANGASSIKCPIRFMDKHSPEEIAHYVETHKHELPRSHEVCLRRYQKDELQIKKIDSKYGNIVSMIEGLSHLHQPMLPEEEQQPRQRSEAGRGSNERVENWAQAVSGTAASDASEEESAPADEDRLSHFDRPLKEIRVGESPSRPWGIQVPVYEDSGHGDEHPMSPPPAPVRMTGPMQNNAPMSTNGTRKCPFDHTKFSSAFGGPPPVTPNADLKTPMPPPHATFGDTPFTSNKGAIPQSTAPVEQPTFLSPAALNNDEKSAPQMVFTGPVFIGYPMDQAIEFMNRYRGSQ